MRLLFRPLVFLVLPSLLSLQGCAVPGAGPSPVAPLAVPYAARPGHRGMWVWHFEAIRNEKAREKLFRFCAAEDIDLLMVQIHYRLNPTTKEPLGLQKPVAYEKLLEEAARLGIRVEALEGAAEWALPERRAPFWARLKVILNWNERQPEGRRFAGLHLDVEPYLLPEFRSESRWTLLRDYLELLQEVRDRVKRSDPALVFAADIPFWYDVHPEGEYEDHCVVEFNGKKAYASDHIQDICDYIGIMSYRRKTLEANGILELFQGELAYAEKIGKKVFAGVEMGPPRDDPPHISFFGTGVPWFRGQIQLLDEAMRGREGYGGLLIHHYLAYREFLEEPNR